MNKKALSRPLLINADCLDAMATLEGESIDAVIVDPPYGITACKWDSVIPLDLMWKELERVIKPKGIIVMTASQPFTSVLVMSNPHMFKQSLVWEKTTASGHLNAKRMHMRAHEDILLFYHKAGTYNPQMTHGHARKTATRKKLSDCYGDQREHESYDSTSRYPRSVIKTTTDKQKSKLHPTQKPIILMEYLINTYTNQGDTVLDFAMGSGTTGVACNNLNRDFIGIEIDKAYFDMAKKRTNE